MSKFSIKQYPGLIIKKHNTHDKRSKDAAMDSLCGWSRTSKSTRQWITALESGQTISVGQYKKPEKGPWIRNEARFEFTHHIFADGDNFDLHHRGDGRPEPITDASEILDKYPDLCKDAYAVGQSARSMKPFKKEIIQEGKKVEIDIEPHCRFRAVFVADEQMKADEYRLCLDYFISKYPFISRNNGSPVQPVTGNSTPETSTYEVFSKTFSKKDVVAKQRKAEAPLKKAQAEFEERKKALGPKAFLESEVDVTALDYVYGHSYWPWFEACCGIKSAGLDFDVFHNWSLRQENYTGEADCERQWKVVKSERPGQSSIGWGTIVYRAEQKGYTRQRREETPPTRKVRKRQSTPPPGKTEKNASSKNPPESKSDTNPPTPDKDAPEPEGDGVYERYFTEKGRFLPARMEQAVVEQFDEPVFLKSEGELRFHRNGVFRKDSGGEIDKHIKSQLGPDWYTPDRVEATLRALKTEYRIAPREDYNPIFYHPDQLNFKNGIYHIETKAFTPHTPDFKSIVQIPVNYDPSITEGPETDKFLHSLLLGNQDDIGMLWTIVGCAMSQKVLIKKVVIFYGPTHTGKSTVLDWIEGVLGIENCSSESLQALDNEDKTYAAAELYGKLANLSADVSPKVLAGDRIKRISAGDKITAQQKYVPAFQFRSHASMFAAGNTLPTSKDKTSGQMDRVLPIHCKNQHLTNANPNQLSLLTQPRELSYAVNKGLEAMHRFIENGARLEPTKTVQMALIDYERKNNPVIDFLDAGFHRTADASIKEEVLWESFKTWCEEENSYLPKKGVFRESVIEWGTNRKQGGKSGGPRYFFFKGIAEGPANPDEEKDLVDEIGF